MFKQINDLLLATASPLVLYFIGVVTGIATQVLATSL